MTKDEVEVKQYFICEERGDILFYKKAGGFEFRQAGAGGWHPVGEGTPQPEGEVHIASQDEISRITGV